MKSDDFIDDGLPEPDTEWEAMLKQQQEERPNNQDCLKENNDPEFVRYAFNQGYFSVAFKLKKTLKFSLGDMVEGIRWATLRSGSTYYSCAIVVSTNPLVLVSGSGDMLWSATIESMELKVIGKAEPKVFRVAMNRFLNDYERDYKENADTNAQSGEVPGDSRHE